MKCSGVGINDWTHGRKNTWTSYEKKVYECWNSMLRRCYNTKCESYKTYGGMGVMVDPRWWRLSNFAIDIQYLQGYSNWKNNTRKRAYHLDKDILYPGNKIYGLQFCQFVTIQQNVYEEHIRNKNNPRYSYNASSKEVVCVETGVVFKNSTEAKEYLKSIGIKRDKGGILKTCEGRQKTCGGYHWRFN